MIHTFAPPSPVNVYTAPVYFSAYALHVNFIVAKSPSPCNLSRNQVNS